ncbi:MAG: DUF3737 family protein [Lachnospiraceae bacterium]|nr:DUF3737 family protein [Lachnospiraceae bacterium]
MTEYIEEVFTGERALFKAEDVVVKNSIFQDGESPLKEANNIEIYDCDFKWKYPLWYSKNIKMKDSIINEMGRAGIWYTDNISVEDTVVIGPKNFRRCKGVKLTNVDFKDAQETLWNCQDVQMTNVQIKGDYIAMGSENLVLNNVTIHGNYGFDGAKNVEVHDSKLYMKDAFWNTENVCVYDSYIEGEYLGWNAKNLTLVNCTIKSLQGFCYIENLKLVNCKLEGTVLAFEYSSVDAEIVGKVDSVLNPKSGTIKADEIGTLMIVKDEVDPEKTKIYCDNVNRTIDFADFSEEEYHH